MGAPAGVHTRTLRVTRPDRGLRVPRLQEDSDAPKRAEGSLRSCSVHRSIAHPGTPAAFSLYFLTLLYPPKVVTQISDRKESDKTRRSGWREGTSPRERKNVLVTVSLVAAGHSFMASDTRLTSTAQEQLRPRVPPPGRGEGPGSPPVPPPGSAGARCGVAPPATAPGQHSEQLSRFQSLGQGAGGWAGGHNPVLRGFGAHT